MKRIRVMTAALALCGCARGSDPRPQGQATPPARVSIHVDERQASVTVGATPLPAPPVTATPLSRPTESDESAGFHVEGTGNTRIMECRGEDAYIEGSNNQVTLTGQVGTLHVEGVGNRVSVVNAKKIQVSGSSNRVEWSGNLPDVSSEGVNNDVREKAGASQR